MLTYQIITVVHRASAPTESLESVWVHVYRDERWWLSVPVINGGIIYPGPQLRPEEGSEYATMMAIAKDELKECGLIPM